MCPPDLHHNRGCSRADTRVCPYIVSRIIKNFRGRHAVPLRGSCRETGEVMDEKIPNSDMDGGWKDIIEDFTEEFFSFYLLEMHAAIDFASGVRFLDRELSEIVSDSENIRREADRLLEVYLKDGGAEWILIHIEVQSYRDRTFAERMYVYNYRIFDKYRRKAVSVAVLIDSDGNYRPDSFSTEQFGCTMHFTFPLIKLLDFDCEGLALERNPFAVVTRVQLAKLQSERDPDRRYSFRMELTRELYDGNYTKEQVIRLYRFIDYVLTLPKPRALEFRNALEQFEEDRKMPYMTSTERIAREEGMMQGITQGITQGMTQGINRGQLENAREAVLDILEVRFGRLAAALQEKINSCSDLRRLKKVLRQAVLIGSPDELDL